MKKYMVLFSAFLLLFTLSGVAGAYTINYDYAVQPGTGGNNYTSPYAGVTVETFDLNAAGPDLSWIWNGTAQIVMTSVSGEFAAPFGLNAPDATWYVSVPDDTTSSGSVLVSLGASYNYLGLWWGSVDTYNTLSFYNNGTWLLDVTGPQAINPSTANGNQTAPSTNLYVNILGLPSFDSFRMTSTQYAFEADNIAVGNLPVPEPTTMLLLGLGLVGLAGMSRRFKR